MKCFFLLRFCTIFQNFPCTPGEKSKSVSFSRVYVCEKAKLTLVSFFYFFFYAPSPMLENTNTYVIPKKLNKPSQAYRRKSFKPYGPNIPNLIFKAIFTKSNQPNETSHTGFNIPNQTLLNQTLPNQTLPNQTLPN